MNPYRLIFTLIVVGSIAATVTGIATNLVNLPEHDEFAYFGNAIYWSGLHPASGMAFNGINYSVTYTERPPLFWWFMTSLFALGMSPYGALVISPLFTALNAILVTLFAYELAGELKYGIFAGLLASVSGFGASVGAHILSDAMGSFFAVLAMYSFYEYFFKNRRPFALLLGASIGLGLVARDEDLITLFLLIILWIIFVPKAGTKRKFLYLLLFGAIFGIPVLLLGLIRTLQLISNIATPLVFDGWPFIVAIGAFIAYFAYRAKTRLRLAELGAAFFAFFVTMLPFFFDNYALGNVDYYIAGKGILARPVSHLMMIPQTAGVGASLSESARFFEWLKSVPGLLSIPVLVFAVLGVYYLARTNKKNFVFLFLWTLVSFGYVVGSTSLEDRFLLIAFAPIMIFAGVGLGYVWKKNYVVGTIFGAVALFLADIIPRTTISISDLTIIAGLRTHSQNWLYSFLPTITLGAPKSILPLSLSAEGLLSLPFALIVICIGVYMATGGPRISPFVTPTIATGSLSLPIRQETLARESNSEIEEEIEIIEGKNVRNQVALDKLVKKNSNSSLQRTSTFKDNESFEEELGWLFSNRETSQNREKKVSDETSEN